VLWLNLSALGVYFNKQIIFYLLFILRLSGVFYSMPIERKATEFGDLEAIHY
jgi:hypothetical protein